MKPYKNRPKIIKGDNGVKTDDTVATFGLPEVNVYPNNRWGDIARSQGLETARNWRKVKEGTTKGINDFANDPRTQFVLTMLPLPQGIESIGNVVKYTGKGNRQLLNSRNQLLASIETPIPDSSAKNIFEAVMNATKGQKQAKSLITSEAASNSLDKNIKMYRRFFDPNYNVRYDPDKFIETKILNNEDFNKIIDINTTNSPTKNIDNVGGLANFRNSEVFLRDKTNRSTAFHEFLHAYNYGDNPHSAWKTKFLFDKNKLKTLNPRSLKYLTDSREVAAQSAQLGEKWGVPVGEPYPGDKKFFELYNTTVGGSPVFFDISTLKNRKRFWNAINGTFFSTLLGSNVLNNNYEKLYDGHLGLD